jgi:hypothetical protein
MSANSTDASRYISVKILECLKHDGGYYVRNLTSPFPRNGEE